MVKSLARGILCIVTTCSAFSVYAFGETNAHFVHKDSLRGAVFSPDGEWVLSSAVSGASKVWSPFTGGQQCAGMGGDVLAFGFSPDGTRYATTTVYGATLSDSVTGARIAGLTNYRTTGLSFSSSRPQVLTSASADNRVEVFSTVDGALVNSFPRSGELVKIGVFSPDGSVILTGGDISRSSTVGILWDASSFTELRRFSSTGSLPTCVGFTPDGALAMLASYDNSVKFFDVNTGTFVRELTGSTRRVYFHAFSPDGTKLVTWGYGEGPGVAPVGTVWDATTGTAISQFLPPATFSPDGSLLLTGKDNQSAVMLNTSTWETVQTFSPLAGGLSCAAFAPDGQRVVLGDGNKTLQVVHIGSGAPAPVDMFNDPKHGLGALLVGGMQSLSPAVQDRFDSLAWADWSDVDMEGFDRLVAGEIASIGDQLPDSYQIALVQYVLENATLPYHSTVSADFEANLQLFRQDVDALAASADGDWAGLKSYERLFAAMLGFSVEMRDSVNAFVKVSTDGVSDLPHRTSYKIFGLSSGKGASEPFSAQGDLDNDTINNLDEYNNVLAAGGDPALFAQAATDSSNLWPGSPNVPVSGSAGIGLLMISILALSARRLAALRNR